MHNPGLRRAWGDGADDQRAHVIEDISFSLNVLKCRCTTEVYAATGLTLEDAWDIHRGSAEAVADRVFNDPRYTPRANDEEVSAFLDLVSDPTYEFEAA